MPGLRRLDERDRANARFQHRIVSKRALALSSTEVAAESGHNYLYVPKTAFPGQIGKNERLTLRCSLHSCTKPEHRGGFWPKAEQEPADSERANAGLVDGERA